MLVPTIVPDFFGGFTIQIPPRQLCQPKLIEPTVRPCSPRPLRSRRISRLWRWARPRSTTWTQDYQSRGAWGIWACTCLARPVVDSHYLCCLFSSASSGPRIISSPNPLPPPMQVQAERGAVGADFQSLAVPEIRMGNGHRTRVQVLIDALFCMLFRAHAGSQTSLLEETL